MAYSQNKEEQITLDYFDNYIGSLLDVGSNDGATLSNSRQLILNGWVGDLVEPSPRAFKKLMQLYANNNSLTLHNIAITNEDKQVVLYESDTHLNKGDVGLLSSTVVSEINRWQNETFTPIKVPGKKFATFIKMATFKTYDFVSIDAEGNDWVILQQINLDDIAL
jgi:FkbM family methyltransferase